ncbi:unannotated protein [freshwater metagenome]|uniref:Unannotated protein n=1 Tax=freshwater metagenome TaxID=449393 RepID=A0A6J7IEE6_9ZZZZ|nr:DUF2236 domain-containing protein [Actinomycetota bacterium]MSY71118.1 DUF2236 domain-containing protein [Actinomycetota bacterium]
MVQPADSVDHVRRELQRRMRLMLTGSATPPVHDPKRVDPGLFGPASSAWRVHADTSMFVGGLRALLLQTLHPLAMAGVADHSDYRHDPLGRLQRTAGYVGITTYGTTAEAKAMIARVRKIHTRVTGIAPDGRPYDARDPRLLGWVHVTEVDSFLAAYQRYAVRPLSDADADQYVAEMAVVAKRIGVKSPPRTRAEMHETVQSYRPELSVGGQARDAVKFLLLPPLPLATRPAYGVISTAAVSLLPGWARRMLWLPVAPGADTLVVRPATTALLRVLGWALAPEPPQVAETA